MAARDLLAGLRARAARLRIDSIRATTAAGSGHPSSCSSAAELAAALFFEVMRFDPTRPKAPENDRFILSKGHTAPLLYAAWAQAGALDSESLTTLRRIDSDLEGHPTPRLPFVDAATGSLGQGLGCGVGMALAGRMDGSSRAIFVLLGDGECAEGSVWEAAEIAGFYGLENLVAIVDVNRFGQSDPTMLQHDLQAYKKRFEAFGWRTSTIDGHHLDQVVTALRRARHPAGRPSVVLARTIKGKGIPGVEDEPGWHGKVLPPELAERAIRALEAELHGARLPEVRRPEQASQPGERPAPVPLPPPPYAQGTKVATREAYGDALAALGKTNGAVVALDGDVKNSTYSERLKEARPGQFVEAFIAEQNMVSMAVGLSVFAKIPFASSFACFLTRAFDQIRMAAISRANVKFCGSHAGVSIGEDGPSQMGLEDLAMFRTIPGAAILYPADGVCAWRCVELAAAHPGIAYIRTTRPKTPVVYDAGEAFRVGGLKVVRAGEGDRVTIVAAGITLHEALAAWEQLRDQGVPARVLDLYSVKPVDGEALLAAARATGNRVLTVEDHYAEGGLGDAVLEALAGEGVRVRKLAVREVPRSGDAAALMDRYGISAGRIVEAARALAEAA